MKHFVETLPSTSSDDTALIRDETGRLVATVIMHGTGQETERAYAHLFALADLESHPAHSGSKHHVQAATEAKAKIDKAEAARRIMREAALEFASRLNG